ncbi:PepSY-like domain-containing protein [Capnocytophaga catalasegens]|uniref:Putative beta-lactamase-inhibitor-like PepSY-like domain-containing protein n=1 Tax=Capnocytophaga catalasegens TaxID=1004260 RepID=A0AAV5B058_9FLAO|nr:PepSY-like domain-containing protein [Capnocytophaga catalasegens]GIZ14475.1 hypothetical protein RCZ03_04760 [Capnocytophaga catalasegens]GJM50677.1 hypothetical protein RCZ15_16500 [Capnocytophaga catalasegens]GJM51830.1 hypothetical protein RCZ16_01480 [Capnocytophaga catalasegens]
MRNFIKNLAIIIFGTSLMAFSCSKDNDVTIPFTNLPNQTQSFVNEYFKGMSVIKAENEANGGYSVDLSNGVEIDFDKDGNWKKVDARDGQALSNTAFIPQNIVEYIAQNYPKNAINGIEKKTTGYEVELVGIQKDIYFDVNGLPTDTKPSDDAGNANSNTNQLPQQASTFLNTYFKNVQISNTKFEKDDIEILLSNGVKIDFDLKGNWKEVDARDGQALSNTAFIPQNIVEYVVQNYTNNAINGIEKKANGDYEVEFVGFDYEVVFDQNGTYKYIKD